MKISIAVTLTLAICFAMPALAEHSVRSAIETANEHLEAAVHSGDIASAISLYTEDAQLMPSNTAPVAGKAAIEAFWQAAMAGIKKIDFVTLEVLGEGNTVSEIGRYEAWGADGQVIDRGKYIVVWKEQDGSWKLHRDIWNTSLSAADHAH